MSTAVPQQNTSEWVEWRKNMVGASDAPIIMGLSKYKTPYELYMQKKGFEPDSYYHAGMKRGHDLEDKARDWYKKQRGVTVLPHVVVSEVYQWMHASLDGISFDGTVGVEIKCPSEDVISQIEKNGILPDHYCQMQQQMYVACLDFMDLVIFDGIEGKILTVQRDEAYILKMLDKLIEFYSGLQNNSPPPETRTGLVYEQTSDGKYKELIDELRSLTARCERDRKIIDKIRDELRDITGGKNTSAFGANIAFIPQKGRVDYDSIPQLQDVNLDNYRKSESVIMRITFS